MASTVSRVTCSAPVNIAVIKYWGKSDKELILPLNSSVSITLDQQDLCSVTTVALSTCFDRDRIWLNDTEEDISNVRLQNCLSLIREAAVQYSQRYSPDDIASLRIHISSKNNFPTAAGLASSASGFACLVFTLAKAFHIEGVDLSEIARQGSGSACRSIYGGFVEWQKGVKADGTDSKAVQIAPRDHWAELEVLVLVVDGVRKAVSSTNGMKLSTDTSDLLKFRAESVVPRRVQEMKEAIRNKDFQTFATLTMKDSNQFHSICMDTYPPLFYLNDTSKHIITLITQYNELKGRVSAAYTFDAGPNAVLITPTENIAELVSLVLHYYPSTTVSSNYLRSRGLPTLVPLDKLIENISLSPSPHSLQYILHTKIGDGPTVLASNNEEDKIGSHLLSDNGFPS